MLFFLTLLGLKTTKKVLAVILSSFSESSGYSNFARYNNLYIPRVQLFLSR